MTTQSNDTFILRDGEGNIFLVSRQAIEAGRVPEDKKAAVQRALEGEVSGYLFGPSFTNVFSTPTFQNAFTNVGQHNTAIGSNAVVGSLVGANSQSLSQLGVNVATVGTNQGVA
jgi:hypothetical protein